MTYRIMMARNGRYYAQKKGRFGWWRISPFYACKGSARNYVEIDKDRWSHRKNCHQPFGPSVVEYL